MTPLTVGEARAILRVNAWCSGFHGGAWEQLVVSARHRVESFDGKYLLGRSEDAVTCPSCAKAPGDSCEGSASHPSRAEAYERRSVLVHASGERCHGALIVDGRCRGCGGVPSREALAIWPMAEATW